MLRDLTRYVSGLTFAAFVAAAVTGLWQVGSPNAGLWVRFEFLARISLGLAAIVAVLALMGLVQTIRTRGGDAA